MTVTRGSIDTRMFNAINEKTKQIWFQTSNNPTNEQGIHLAGGILNATFSTNTPNTWGYNTFITNGGLKLRYNQIDLVALSTNALTFYSPSVTSKTISGSVKAMELGTSALTFYGPDDGEIPLATFETSEIQIGQNANGKSRTEIGTEGLQIIQKSSGTDTQIANLGYGKGATSSGTADAPFYSFGTRKTGTAAYNSSSTYSIGDICVYSGKKYVCIADITTAEAWTSSHWQLLIGANSFTQGKGNIASGYNSHAQGMGAFALGHDSHAEGSQQPGPEYTIAVGEASHAEGMATKSVGRASHSEGLGSKATGNASHAQNVRTIAASTGQTAVGKYNVSDNADTYAVIVGNGTADNARSNALTVDWNGNVDMTGQLKTSFKTSVAMGSYGSAQTTVDGLAGEIRYSSGAAGSASINTAYTKSGVTIPTGWYNFFYMPHRSGGNSGAADGDNHQYGNLFLFGMNNTNGQFIVRVSSGSVAEVVKLVTTASVISESKLLKDNVTINANSYGNGSLNVSKTNYTPIGIVGMHLENASSSGVNNTYCACHSFYLSGSTAYWIVKNNHTSSAKIKVTATILYVAS